MPRHDLLLASVLLWVARGMDSGLVQDQVFFVLKGHKAILTCRVLAQPVFRPAVLHVSRPKDIQLYS